MCYYDEDVSEKIKFTPEKIDKMNKSVAEYEQNGYTNSPEQPLTTSQQPTFNNNTQPPGFLQNQNNNYFIELNSGTYICEDKYTYQIYTCQLKEQIRNIMPEQQNNIIRNAKKTLIADFIICKVLRTGMDKGYPEKYILDVRLFLKSNQYFDLRFSQFDFENKRIMQILRNNSLANLIHCGESEANQILSKLISEKIYDTQSFIPYRTGFYASVNNTYVFKCHHESYQTTYPNAVINKTFPAAIEISKEEVLKALADKISDSVEFAFTLTIHYTAMLSSILKQNGLRFSKLIVSNSDYDTTREFLDIYGELHRNTLVSSGEAVTKLQMQTFCTRDDILYIGEQNTQYKPTTREVDRTQTNIDFLINTFCKGQYFDVNARISNVNADCLCVFINGYASESLTSDRIIPLTIPEINSKPGEIRSLIRNTDVYFVQWVSSNAKRITDHFVKCIADINKYAGTSDDFCNTENGLILMYVYMLIFDFFMEYSPLKVTPEHLLMQMHETMNKSEQKKDNFVISQVKEVISSLIINKEIEIIHSDKVFMTRALSSAPKVYYRDDMLYFEPKLFDEKIASEIGGVTSGVALKKILLNENLLVSDDKEYTVKRRLSGTEVQKRYTCVSVDLLNKEAHNMLPSAYATFLQCNDDGKSKRIRLGHDELYRGIYWSIEHPDMINQTMLVSGSPNCGKSSFVFQLVRSAAKKGECMVYLDYNHSCTREEFKKFGATDEWIDSNIMYVNYKKYDYLNILLSNALHLTDSSKIIVITIDDNGEELSYEDKAEETDNLLRYILDWCVKQENPHVRVIIDEINVAHLGKGTIIDQIITQKRKFGISLIMISPDIQNLKPTERNTLMNASTKVVFRQDNNSARNNFAQNMSSRSKSTLADYLVLLPKFVCCFSGNLEDVSGNMQSELIQIHVDTYQDLLYTSSPET